MADRPRNVERLLPLKPKVFHILLSLADGPTHGYAVMQEVRARTEGKVRLWPTGLYGALREMEKSGLIVETDERPSPGEDDERRRYFELTSFGRQVLDGEVARLKALVDMALAIRSPGKTRRA